MKSHKEFYDKDNFNSRNAGEINERREIVEVSSRITHTWEDRLDIRITPQENQEGRIDCEHSVILSG